MSASVLKPGLSGLGCVTVGVLALLSRVMPASVTEAHPVAMAMMNVQARSL
jgi:hypothetical protein